MANKTTTSYVQEDPQADECRENIPPEVSDEAGTSKLRVSAENETLHSSVQLCEENRPICDPPAPTSDNSEVRAKSGCQSALTPVLKSLNIDNKFSSSQLLKRSYNPHLSFSFSSMSFSQVNFQQSTSQLFCGLDAPLCLIEEECLPEVTGLDFTNLELTTNDSVLPENESSSSKLDNEVKRVQTNAAEDNDDPLEVLPRVNTTMSTDVDGKICFKNTNVPAATGITETEITLLDASNYSVLSPVGQMTFMDNTRGFTPADHLKDKITLSELSRQIVSESGSSITVPNENLSNTSVQSKCATKTTIRTSLDAMMVSVLEKSNSLSETRGQKMEEPQTPDKDEVGAQPANITQNISSSSGMSVQGVHLSTSAVKCNTSSAGVTSEVHSDPAKNSDPVKTECEEVQTSCDIKSTSGVSQQIHTWTASRNGTFTLLQSSNESAASDCNTTTSASCPKNRTFDLLENSAKSESEIRDQAKSSTTTTSEKESSQGKVQNATFDRSSLQKTCDSSSSGGAAADDHSRQNTFDCEGPPQKNITVTLSEISSGDIPCNTLDEPFSPKVSNLATHLKDEDHSSELPKPETAAAAQPNDDKADKHNDTSEINSALDSAPGVGGCEFNDLSQSGLLLPDGHFNTLNNWNMVNNKANTFDLDEDLDLEANFLITSTPMTSNKTSNAGIEQMPGTNLAVQKKLYQDDPNKPTDQAASNIICDRKTFFVQPVPRVLRPASKATSQVLKKPGPTVPERLERVTTGLPVKRQKTQASGVKIAAVEEPQGTSGLSNSCSLLSLAAASKLPTFGLQRPQQSGIPSGISKAAPGLRPLSTRSNRFASSSTNKPTEPTAKNPVTKSSQGKKHPLSKGDTLPIPKKKKTDTVVPSSNTEATTSSNDTTNRVKTLKQPTASMKSAPAQIHSSGAAGPTGSSETSTSCDVSSRLRALKPPGAGLRAPLAKAQGQGCLRCGALKEEIRHHFNEIQRLKQELQKHQKDSGICQ